MRQSWTLAAVLLGLVALDVGAHRRAAELRAPLPALEATPVEAIDWIEIHQGDESLRIERSGASWAVAQPYRHPADPVAVEQILAVLTAGVRPDARLGEGDLDRYGLSGADPVRVECGGDGAVLSALYVGFDAPGGATFVRFAQSERVYRARIGGRDRFARPARSWRDPHLWTATAIASIRVSRQDGQELALLHTEAGWSLAQDPTFPVDPALADAVAGALADLRAVDVFSAEHPAGLRPPAAQLEVTAADGVHTASLGLQGEDGFASLPGREGTYRLPGRLVQRLLADREAWRDHTLWTLAPASLRELEWIGPHGSVHATRDPRTGQWVGPGLDSRVVAAVAGFLARPRVERFVELSPADAGLPGVRSLAIVGSTTHTLQIGALAPGALDGRDGVYVRSAGDPRIGLLEADVVARITGISP